MGQELIKGLGLEFVSKTNINNVFADFIFIHLNTKRLAFSFQYDWERLCDWKSILGDNVMKLKRNKNQQYMI